jgi:peptide/nickel transport system ATP-binding protein/oligopeptide transport system ATP-binding protein
VNRETALLAVENLHTVFRTDDGIVRAVNGVSFEVHEGETLGIVGESGCGKSVTAFSIMRLIPSPPGKIAEGTVRFRGQDLLGISENEMRLLRGNQISMIFQEPMYTVGNQIMEAVRLHQKVGKREARKRAVEMLEHVGIPSPEQRVDEYPHQLSGGMRQRVMIAMALSCRPGVLIADEPTTALDVTIQAQILELLKKLQREMGMAIILITHDLGVIAETADNVAVMYAGRVVEQAPARALFDNPQHPYTIGLLESIPKANERKERLSVIPGTVPPPTAFPKGCAFHPRCPFIVDECRRDLPALESSTGDHLVRCHRWRDVPKLRTEGISFSS